MAFCPADCAEITLVQNPIDCNFVVRRKIPARIGFYACNTVLPDPLDATALETLITTGGIVFSSKLSQVAFQDPTYEDLQAADCLPNQRLLSTREVQFQDRQALIGATTSSPSEPIPYFDWTFWADKITKSSSLNALIMYCDGDVIICRNDDGTPLSLDLTAFVNYDTAANGGGLRTEFKQLSAVFNGDPLNLNWPPSFNVNQQTGEVTIL